MPSPQLRHPFTVATVSCGRCKQEQVVQILAQTGFWLRARQSVKCLKCGQEFEVMLPDAIIGGARKNMPPEEPESRGSPTMVRRQVLRLRIVANPYDVVRAL